MKSKAIFQTLSVDHPEDHDHCRSVTLKQRGNEIHLSDEIKAELIDELRGGSHD